MSNEIGSDSATPAQRSRSLSISHSAFPLAAAFSGINRAADKNRGRDSVPEKVTYE